MRRDVLVWAIGVISCLGVTSVRVAALDPAQAIDRYVHRVWTTDDGLPQNSIYAALQTRDGYLWLGTDEGLVRFDGLRFTIFDRTNAPGMTDPFVYALHEAADGSVWAGTDRGGLIRYRDGRFTHYGAAQGLPAGRIQAIASDTNGAVWVGLRGAGIARLTADRFAVLTTADGLSANNVVALHVDRRGTVRAGTDKGLDRFDGTRFVAEPLGSGHVIGPVRAIHEDRAGQLWAGVLGGAVGARTRGGSLCRVNAACVEVVSATDPTPVGVMAITEDRDGQLWLGTAGGGIVRHRAGRFDHWMLSDSPADDMVYALLEDREGSLWIGTQPGGLHRLQNSRFVNYGKREGLRDEVVESLYEDPSGAMWIGTHAGGLCRMKGADLVCPPLADGLTRSRINAILGDANGGLWLGTETGLSRLKDTSTVHYTASNGLPVDHVNALLRDRHGALWIGTWGGGVARRAADRIERVSGSTGLYINVLFERRSGEIWIGATDGVSIWDGHRMIDGVKDLGLPVAVESLHEDADGYLWIGTRRDGLFLYRDGTLTQFDEQSGLYDNLVGTLLEVDGAFWITCNKGIFRVSRQELLEVAAGTREAVASRLFDTADGMKNRECNFGQGRWRARSGHLWFATVGGVAIIDPASVNAPMVSPRVRIEELTVDGGAVPIAPPPTLAYDARRVEFRFAGLSLAAPARVRYRYRLDGFDSDWIDARDERRAQYTNLAPGAYRFRVMASNGDGVWSSDDTTLAFAIAEPLWRRPWFVLLTATFLVGAAIAAVNGRVARLKRAQAVQAEFSRQLIASQERERKRLAGELHDGIGQQLLIISNWARLARDTPAAARTASSLDVITKTALESIQDVRRLTHDLQPYELDHIGLRGAIDAMLQRVGDPAGIRFTTDIETVDDAFGPDAIINLYRIVQEAANNTVKHAQATEARVTLKRMADTIVLTVADNGHGFPAGSTTAGTVESGFGLRSLAARTRLLNGTHRIQAEAGRGTTIVVEIPIPPAKDPHAS